MDFKDRIIAVVGLGYVGLPLAVEFGKTRTVIGFDLRAERINELKAKFDRTREIDPSELISAAHLTFTCDATELQTAQIYIVTVPTPVDKSNQPDLRSLKNASVCVGNLLKPGDCVIYESTVYPGATEEICVPILEQESGLRFNTDFFCGYSPERINPGDKMHRLPNIKKITSGSTPEAADAIDALYREIVSIGTHRVSSIKIAEAAKVIENAQRDLNIAFVNELSVIFNLMGIDTIEVLKAAATKWNFVPFNPGLVGGHCISVDPYYLTYKAQELGYHAQVILAGRRINDDMGRYAARNIIRMMLRAGIDVASSTVGVLGITFKENCPDVRNSKVFDIVNELQEWGVAVKIMDPWANLTEVRKEYDLNLEIIDSRNTVDSLVVAVAHKEFASMSPSELRKLCVHQATPVIADLKALYDPQQLNDQGFQVFRL